jgi:hypothetical protein
MKSKKIKSILLFSLLSCQIFIVAQTPVLRKIQPITNTTQPNGDRFKIKGSGTTILSSIVTADFSTTIYNNGNSTVIDLTTNLITFNKAGMYRLEFGAMAQPTTQAGAGIIATLIINGNSAEYADFSPAIKRDATYSASIKFTTDRYFAAGTSLKISLDGGFAIGDLYLAGYLISE